MNLFLNAVSEKWVIFLFDDEKMIVAKKYFNVRQKESALLIGIIDDFLKENGQEYNQINNIVVVAWPWSFTGIRTIILVVNTLVFIFPNIYLTSLSFFDLFNNYPIIKQASKRDIFVKMWKDKAVENIKNEAFLSLIKEKNNLKVYGDYDQAELIFWINIDENINYSIIIKNLLFQKQKQLTPIYIKKPSIS